MTVILKFTKKIKFILFSCQQVCLNATIDLVFNACYLLKSSFMLKNLKRNITEKIFYIENQYTEEQFQNNTAMMTVVHHDR